MYESAQYDRVINSVIRNYMLYTLLVVCYMFDALLHVITWYAHIHYLTLHAMHVIAWVMYM